MADKMVSEFQELLSEGVSSSSIEDIKNEYNKLSKVIGKEADSNHLSNGKTIDLKEPLVGSDGPLVFKNHNLYGFSIDIPKPSSPENFTVSIDPFAPTELVGEFDSSQGTVISKYNILNRPNWKSIKDKMNKKFIEIVSKKIK